MKVHSLLLTGLAITLAGCASGSDSTNPPTQAEIDMAEMMGITVEELRSQTPEEHMQMMQEMMEEKEPSDETGQKNAAPTERQCNGGKCSCMMAQVAPDEGRKQGCGCKKAGACAARNKPAA